MIKIRDGCFLPVWCHCCFLLFISFVLPRTLDIYNRKLAFFTHVFGIFSHQHIFFYSFWIQTEMSKSHYSIQNKISEKQNISAVWTMDFHDISSHSGSLYKDFYKYFSRGRFPYKKRSVFSSRKVFVWLQKCFRSFLELDTQSLWLLFNRKVLHENSKLWKKEQFLKNKNKKKH